MSDHADGFGKSLSAHEADGGDVGLGAGARGTAEEWRQVRVGEEVKAGGGAGEEPGGRGGGHHSRSYFQQ